MDTAQRAFVIACMACYVLFVVAIATPERHTERIIAWVVARIRRDDHDEQHAARVRFRGP